MSDFKSKLPDLKELGEITGKLFKDIRNSVSEIISDYKAKHADLEKTQKTKEKKEEEAPKEEAPKEEAKKEEASTGEAPKVKAEKAKKDAK